MEDGAGLKVGGGRGVRGCGRMLWCQVRGGFHVLGGQGHDQLSSHVNKFEQVYSGQIELLYESTDRHTHMTENITYPHFVASCNKSIANVVSSDNLHQDIWTPNPFSHTCLNLFNLVHPDNLNSLSVRAVCPSWCLKIDVVTGFYLALLLHSNLDISVIVKERCRVDYHIWIPREALALSGFLCDNPQYRFP